MQQQQRCIRDKIMEIVNSGINQHAYMMRQYAFIIYTPSLDIRGGNNSTRNIWYLWLYSPVGLGSASIRDQPITSDADSYFSHILFRQYFESLCPVAGPAA